MFSSVETATVDSWSIPSARWLDKSNISTLPLTFYWIPAVASFFVLLLVAWCAANLKPINGDGILWYSFWVVYAPRSLRRMKGKEQPDHSKKKLILVWTTSMIMIEIHSQEMQISFQRPMMKTRNILHPKLIGSFTHGAHRFPPYHLITLHLITLHLAPCTLQCAPCTLRLAICSLHCATCTMHHAPCTLNRASCALHFAPFSSHLAHFAHLAHLAHLALLTLHLALLHFAIFSLVAFCTFHLAPYPACTRAHLNTHTRILALTHSRIQTYTYTRMQARN